MRNHFRAVARRGACEHSGARPELADDDPLEAAASAEATAGVPGVVERLRLRVSPRDLDAAGLHFSGLGYGEIAGRLGEARETSSRRTGRVVRALREVLAERSLDRAAVGGDPAFGSTLLAGVGAGGETEIPEFRSQIAASGPF